MSERSGEGAVSLSLLVRFWLEPREGAEDEPILRGSCRNLKTGEETHVQAPKSLTEHIERELESLRREKATALHETPEEKREATS